MAKPCADSERMTFECVQHITAFRKTFRAGASARVSLCDDSSASLAIGMARLRAILCGFDSPKKEFWEPAPAAALGRAGSAPPILPRASALERPKREAFSSSVRQTSRAGNGTRAACET